MASSMEAGVFRGDIPEDVWCRYCNDVYKDPKLLPCLHTMCRKCLQEIQTAQKGEIACPVCLTEVKCKLEDLLPNVLAQKKLVEFEKWRTANRRETCGGCDSQPNGAVFRCMECEEFLCDECIQAHQRVKFTKGHEILSLQELAENDNASRESSDDVYCPVHQGMILDMFCKECDVAVCKECRATVHYDTEKHKHVSIEEILDSIKLLLRESLNETKAKIPVLQKSLYEIIKRYGRVQTKAEDITWQIRKTSRHLIQAVKDREHQLLGELHALQERRSSGLVREKEIMERKLIRTIDGCEFTDELIREGKQAEVAMVKRLCTERLETLQQEKTECQLDKVKLTFEPEEEPVVRAIQEAFGRLLVLNAPPATGNTSSTGTTDPAARMASREGSTESLDNYENVDAANDDRDTTKEPGARSKKMTVAFSEPDVNTSDNKSKPDKPRSRLFSLPLLIGKTVAKPVGKTTPTTFTLATVDHKGQRKEVQVHLESPDGSVISAHVLDNKDGTYTVFYCPRTPGEHNVYISLSGRDIKHGSRLLNIYGSLKGMRGDELALACKALCLIRWQITPGLVQVKKNKTQPNPKITFDDIGGPPGVSTA